MKKTSLIIAPLCAAVVGFAVGYFAGDSRAYRSGIDRLRFETAGNVSYRVEALSRLRTGDVDRTVTLIEQNMDQGISSLSMRQKYSELPEVCKQALMVAKLYRTAFPSGSPAVAESLAQVPLITPDHEYCSPALARISDIAHRDEP